MNSKKMNTLYESEWEKFDETPSYQRYCKKKKERSENSSIELVINNKLNLNNKKIKETIRKLVNKVFRKFGQKKKWKIEVWLDENNVKNNMKISCGVKLVRPKRQKVYVSRVGMNLCSALSPALDVIERNIRSEKERFS